MPIVMVHGIPNSVKEDDLSLLVDGLRGSISDIPELGITFENVTVFLVPDMLQEGLGEEICVQIIGLFDKSERTDQVRQRIADQVAHFVYAIIAQCIEQLELIEVLVYKFDQVASGFGRWHKDDGFSDEQD